jgi:hypothetical protein
MGDKALVKYLFVLLLLPLALAYFSDGERYRYPCQNPINWDKEMCKLPLCDVNRTCPEHIFKGQRDPRTPAQTPAAAPTAPTSGVTCK